MKGAAVVVVACDNKRVQCKAIGPTTDASKNCAIEKKKVQCKCSSSF